MSEFHSGKYNGVDFGTTPLIFGKRFKKPKIFWHAPHWTAQKVTFEIFIDSQDNKRLIHDYPIFIKASNSLSEANRVEENEDCVLSDDGKRLTITSEGLRGSYTLEYYLGSPNGRNSNSQLIVELRANWRDSKWFIIYGLAGGFIGSLILFIIGLLFEFVRINPAWEVFLIP